MELDRLGRSAGATYYMSRLAVIAASLALKTGHEELLIGTPVSTRTRVELQAMIGPFIDFRPLRFHFEPESSFREWLEVVRGAVIDASANASIPWEVLRRRLVQGGTEVRGSWRW